MLIPRDDAPASGRAFWPIAVGIVLGSLALWLAFRGLDLVEVIPYAPGEVDAESLASDFNRYQVALNLPSVFAGHPTRVLEGMACGCCVVTNRTGIAEVDGLFQDGVDLVYFSGEDEAEAALLRLRADPAAAQAIAERGRRKAAEKYSLTRLLSGVVDWVESHFPGVALRHQ